MALASTCARDLVQRGGQAQQLVGVDPIAGGDDTSASTGPPLGQGAGLVEQHHPPGGEPFQRAAALDDDSDAARPGTART